MIFGSLQSQLFFFFFITIHHRHASDPRSPLPTHSLDIRSLTESWCSCVCFLHRPRWSGLAFFPVLFLSLPGALNGITVEVSYPPLVLSHSSVPFVSSQPVTILTFLSLRSSSHSTACIFIHPSARHSIHPCCSHTYYP
ncbi:hypothetical protein BDV98DRAFT_42080 [Pterulicium gracile]|uniref:Secreted protein n=1 Tax=Pterulicium gracile TaxID=1884261 RepID=A0A5C3R0U9_9AGAR|nr:hypothetical protein BDV98DRAFT_42080 [Pterula gracilis]